MPAKKKPARAYQLKITLLEIEPPIWRRFVVRADTPLPKLHRVIQAVMGWADYHLHAFCIADERFGVPDPHFEDDTHDERGIKLRRFVGPGERVVYEYDFGDGWQHLVEVEQELPTSDLKHVPACLEGERSCPPEDCGGAWGYAEFLEAIADPEHEEHESMLEWVGGSFDPEAFDPDSVNETLREIR